MCMPSIDIPAPPPPIPTPSKPGASAKLDPLTPDRRRAKQIDSARTGPSSFLRSLQSALQIGGSGQSGLSA